MMNKPEKKIFVEFCEDRNLRDFSGDIPVVYGKIATAHGGHFIAFGGQDGNGIAFDLVNSPHSIRRLAQSTRTQNASIRSVRFSSY